MTRTGFLSIICVAVFGFCLCAWFFYKHLRSYREVCRICGLAEVSLAFLENTMGILNEQEKRKEQGEEKKQEEGETQGESQEKRESEKQGAKSNERVKSLTKLKVKLANTWDQLISADNRRCVANRLVDGNGLLATSALPKSLRQGYALLWSAWFRDIRRW